jgi:hypothetical protein
MASFFITFIRFGRAIKKGFKDPEFRGLLFFVLAILFSGTLFYHFSEGWSYIDSLYFSVTTLTTVGGDGTPHTVLGKVFTIIYVFVGIGIILGFINRVAHFTHKKTFVQDLMQFRNIDEKN